MGWSGIYHGMASFFETRLFRIVRKIGIQAFLFFTSLICATAALDSVRMCFSVLVIYGILFFKFDWK